MKIVSIGDIHGLDVWKTFEDIPQLISGTFTPNYDYYVFVGDYVDSFDKTNIDILNNLNEIINFKKKYPQNVILLWGNHDIQYFTSFGEHGCTGFRPEAYFDLHEIFRKNKDMFQLGFQIDNYLWTHAGVHMGWYKYDFPYKSQNVADDLNFAFLENNKSIFNVGFRRGGLYNVGGPLWADKSETSKKPLYEYHQIVGHTRIITGEIQTINKNKNTSITFIDVLEDNGAKPYIININ